MLWLIVKKWTGRAYIWSNSTIKIVSFLYLWTAIFLYYSTMVEKFIKTWSGIWGGSMQYWSASEYWKWYLFDFIEVKKLWFCMGTIATVYALIFHSITKVTLKISNILLQIKHQPTFMNCWDLGISCTFPVILSKTNPFQSSEMLVTYCSFLL